MIVQVVATLVIAALTPGAVRPLSLATVCATKWGLDVRHVSKAKKARVFTAYGIPVADRHLYVIDHLIPRELAGSDLESNLWPEVITPSYAKDHVEGALHRAICKPVPTITLHEAQEQMRRWSGE